MLRFSDDIVVVSGVGLTGFIIKVSRCLGVASWWAEM